MSLYGITRPNWVKQNDGFEFIETQKMVKIYDVLIRTIASHNNHTIDILES